MKITSAITGNKLAAHYGLTTGAGALGFAYQLLAVLFCTAVVLFTGAEAVSATGLPGKALLTVVTVIGFFAGAKGLIRVADAGVKRIATSVTNKVLHFVVTLALLIAFLGVVMSWPAIFLFALSKFAPIGFASWSNAFSAGFGVLCCDTVLSGLTGVSLLGGKRDKLFANTSSATTNHNTTAVTTDLASEATSASAAVVVDAPKVAEALKIVDEPKTDVTATGDTAKNDGDAANGTATK